MMDTPDGPTCALLSSKGKRPQVQITEAQILNDKTGTNREAAMNKQKVFRAKQWDKNTDKNNRSGNQVRVIWWFEDLITETGWKRLL